MLLAGFIFKGVNAIRNAEQTVPVDGRKFADRNTNGFFTIVEHSN